jgi:hypothetical protein
MIVEDWIGRRELSMRQGTETFLNDQASQCKRLLKRTFLTLTGCRKTAVTFRRCADVFVGAQQAALKAPHSVPLRRDFHETTGTLILSPLLTGLSIASLGVTPQLRSVI